MSQETELIGIGNVYVETNYLGLITGGSNTLEEGKEYGASRYETRLGGSVVNFIIQAKELGFNVGLIGKTGQDEAGDKLRALLDEAGVSSDLVVSSPEVQTSVDTGVVFEHNGQNIQFVAGGANRALSRADINLSDPTFNGIRGVYLGGFLKQEALYRDYPTLVEEFNNRGIKVFLDHGRIPVDVTGEQRDKLTQTLSLVEGYLPNEQEVLGITGEQSLAQAINKVLDMGVKIIAVKLGENGCRIRTQEEDIMIPGHKVDVVSTVGAGDAFNAGFVTSYLKGLSLEECGTFANATAALRVSNNRQHTVSEIEEFLKNNG